MRNSGLMALPILLGACTPEPNILSNLNPVAVDLAAKGSQFRTACSGYNNGLEDLVHERTDALLKASAIKSSADDLSRWECTPILAGGGIVSRLDTRFRDRNGTVWVVKMPAPTEETTGLSASLN